MTVCQGFVLKCVNYSDTQRIVHLYTQERGMLSMISPASVFKRKSQPVLLLQIVEVEYEENDRGGLHKLKSASVIANLSDVYFDIYKMNILLLWGEILYLMLRNEGRNGKLFEFVARSVEYLNISREDVANFNLFFLYRLASPMGFRIDAESWREGHVFHAGDGCFHAPESGTPCISGPNTAKIIHRLCTCEVEDLKGIPLNREARNILLDVILTFYSIHLNIDFRVKSIRVIREIFA